MLMRTALLIASALMLAFALTGGDCWGYPGDDFDDDDAGSFACPAGMTPSEIAGVEVRATALWVKSAIVVVFDVDGYWEVLGIEDVEGASVLGQQPQKDGGYTVTLEAQPGATQIDMWMNLDCTDLAPQIVHYLLEDLEPPEDGDLRELVGLDE